MPMYNLTHVNKIMVDSQEYSKAYSGSQLVWEAPFGNHTILTPAMVSGILGGSGQRYIGTATHLIIDDNFPTNSLNSLFRDNQTLKSLVILTDKFTSMNNTFRGIGNQFQSLVINTSNVTDMSWMFYDSQAPSLDLSSFDTSNVTNMTRMFNGSQATTIDLSSFDTSNVTNMTRMFNGSQATTIDLSSFDTSKVTNMTYMFSGSQVTSLDLSSFNTSNVTSMGQMFSGSQVANLDLSSFDTSNVTSMTYMFNDAQATTGYARTQADADRFNASSNKPSTLNFIVKP